MADEDDDYESASGAEVSDEEIQDPALKNFNRTAFKIKYTLKQALKWAAIGAVAAAALACGLAIMGLWAGGPLSVVGMVVGYFIPGALPAVGGMALTAGLWTTAVGAAAGLLMGATTAFSSADEAADAEQDKIIARAQQAQARLERQRAIAARRDQQRLAYGKQAQAMGLNPNVGFGMPRGRGNGAVRT